jgi:hypothetical protein
VPRSAPHQALRENDEATGREHGVRLVPAWETPGQELGWAVALGGALVPAAIADTKYQVPAIPATTRFPRTP